MALVRRNPATEFDLFTITIGYYLRHKEAIEAYLSQREQLADSVQERLSRIQPDLSSIRARLRSQRNR